MTYFSNRFSLLILVAAALALALIGYTKLLPELDECPNPAALLDPRAIDPRAVLITKGHSHTDFSKERVTARIPADQTAPTPLLYSISRSYGLPARLFQPAMVIQPTGEPATLERAVLEVDGNSLPYQYAYEPNRARLRVTAYFMTHQGSVVESPLWTLVSNSPSAFIEGRWPITLFVAATTVRHDRREDAERQIRDWIRTSWRHYQATCGA